ARLVGLEPAAHRLHIHLAIEGDLLGRLTMCGGQHHLHALPQPCARAGCFQAGVSFVVLRLRQAHAQLLWHARSLLPSMLYELAQECLETARVGLAIVARASSTALVWQGEVSSS